VNPSDGPTRLIKAEGAGNDFLLGTGAWVRRLTADPDLVVRLCDRRRGVGADGVLAIERTGPESIRVAHRNADGSGSAFCANGTRCAARAAVELLTCPPALRIETGWAEIPALVVPERVTLELPPPSTPTERTLETETGPVTGWLLSVGVPHFVHRVENLMGIDLERVARPLRSHPGLGPDGANIHFVEMGPTGSLAIRSLERGVESEVLCCGSGVVAAALVTMTANTLTVIPASGDPLVVESLAAPPTTASRLAGPARLVAEIAPLF
jgi:diaminopimelate epimerase